MSALQRCFEWSLVTSSPTGGGENGPALRVQSSMWTRNNMNTAKLKITAPEHPRSSTLAGDCLTRFDVAGAQALLLAVEVVLDVVNACAAEETELWLHLLVMKRRRAPATGVREQWRVRGSSLVREWQRRPFC